MRFDEMYYLLDMGGSVCVDKVWFYPLSGEEMIRYSDINNNVTVDLTAETAGVSLKVLEQELSRHVVRTSGDTLHALVSWLMFYAEESNRINVFRKKNSTIKMARFSKETAGHLTIVLYGTYALIRADNDTNLFDSLTSVILKNFYADERVALCEQLAKCEKLVRHEVSYLSGERVVPDTPMVDLLLEVVEKQGGFCDYFTADLFVRILGASGVDMDLVNNTLRETLK